MRYAAFMRGLNLGKRNVKMDDLKKLFVKLGFTEVESFIASGNIVFEAGSKNRAAMELTIEAAIEKKYGWVSETFVRDFGELAKIGAAMPFKGVVDAPTYLVGFLKAPIDAGAKKKFLALASPVDMFASSGAEVWWHSPISQAESKFNANVFDKALGVRSTWRNLRTVRRMVERWGNRI
jgi:uncharacterized protein (DUF1697 family)